MKEQIIQAVNNLKGFLDNIDSINKHPYSKGVDVDKLIIDLKDYAKDLENMVNQIEEVSADIEVETKENN